jgi:diguanylate cyclase (GGDEF)-like protein
MNKFYDSLKLKLMMTCMVALFVIIAVVHIAMYMIIKNIVSEQIGLSAQSVAVAIAASIMEDVEEYEAFLETRDINSAYYQRMQQYFAHIKTNNPGIKFIYTERAIDEETVEFLLDAAPVPGDNYTNVSLPGETTFMDEASRAVYATKQPAVLPPTHHPTYGTLLGGCAPLFSRKGTLLGLVGVNLDISHLFAQLSRLQYTMLALYALIMGVCFVLLNKYSGAILDPMVKDKLTGAYSKRYYDALIDIELKNAKKNGTELALLMLDLDHFKRINDTYGHSFGDVVLTATSRTVMRCLRSDDYFIRYGGEEFAVIIPNVSIETVLKIAERIRVSVERSDIYNDEMNQAIRMTISIGVAHLNGRHSGKELVANADKALYNAKVTRNAVSLFSAGVEVVQADGETIKKAQSLQ